MPPKKLSGYENRKRRRQQEEASMKHPKLSSFFIAKPNSAIVDNETDSISLNTCPSDSSLNPNDFEVNLTEDTIQLVENNNELVPCAVPENLIELKNSIVSENSIGVDNSIVAEEIDVEDANITNSAVNTGNVEHPNINFNDPAQWPDILSAAERNHIIVNGPYPINKQSIFPKDANNRCFSVSMMFRKINNGETFIRRWLIYSESTNKIYCFSCKIFGCSERSMLSKSGLSDWKHAHEYLKSHENSSHHLEYLKKWFEASRRLQTNQTIDKELQSQIENERQHWCKVLKRLMSITKFLAERNLAFRGTTETLFTPHNGNFLGLVELLGKFDLTMSEHVRRVVSKETHVHYCGKKVQNEIINLLGHSVQEDILCRAKSAKYYSLILDCTPDISHVEQLSFTIRFVDAEDMMVKEHFLSYKAVVDTTGQGLFDNIIEYLEELNLDLINCRGQGYDNGSNMKGKNKGTIVHFYIWD